MCGIVGIASHLSNGFSGKEAAAFMDMLFLDTLRGSDSTGVFGVDKHSNVRIHKEASHGLDFMNTTEMKEFKYDLIRTGLFAVGHNRAATRGSVRDANAHPFWVDDKIVLVQNGTYKGSHKHHKDTEVDTEAVAHVLSENANIEDALKKINAAYALAWFNTETHSLHLIRNDERPLWLLKTKLGSLMWASEAWMLTVAASRNGIDYDERPILLEPHTLVTLTIDGNHWKREDTPLPNSKYEAPRFQNEFMAGNEYDVPFNFQKVVPHIHQLPWKGGKNKSNTIDIHVFQILWDACKEAATTIQHAEYLVQTITQIIEQNTNKQVLIEFFDYHKANDSRECSVWHVFGKVVVPDNHPMEDLVVHTTLFDKNELDVMNYIQESGYTGTLHPPRLLQKPAASGQVLAAAASYVPFPTPFKMDNVH